MNSNASIYKEDIIAYLVMYNDEDVVIAVTSVTGDLHVQVSCYLQACDVWTKFALFDPDCGAIPLKRDRSKVYNSYVELIGG